MNVNYNKMEYKRQRKEVNYHETDTVFGPEIHRTSDWKSATVKDLHIRISNNNFFILNYNSDDIINISDEAWNSPIDIKNLAISPEYKTLVLEIKRIYDANNSLAEHYVDTYVNTLLHIIGFNRYPLSINLQHIFETDLGEEEIHISSVPDFVVRSEVSKIMIIIEDKNSKHAKYNNQWMENQIMGEIFVAAHSHEKASEIYAVRIIGTLFTFYKAKVSLEYIRETLEKGKPTKEYMDVERYPDPGNELYRINAFDFCKVKDRKIILECLNKIKQPMEIE